MVALSTDAVHKCEAALSQWTATEVQHNSLRKTGDLLGTVLRVCSPPLYFQPCFSNLHLIITVPNAQSTTHYISTAINLLESFSRTWLSVWLSAGLRKSLIFIFIAHGRVSFVWRAETEVCRCKLPSCACAPVCTDVCWTYKRRRGSKMSCTPFAYLNANYVYHHWEVQLLKH